MARAKKSNTSSGATLGFEEKLWAAADKMRWHMDAAEYKHVALGLVFLKYISKVFRDKHNRIAADPDADPEDRGEYSADNVFWAPKAARWRHLQDNAKQPTIGKLLDDAMVAIENDNPSLKGVLPKDYARPSLDKQRLGELIDLMGAIEFRARDEAGLFDSAVTANPQDILGRVYEYFLGKFASPEGKGGEFYTPQLIVKLLVEIIEPYKGRIYDPCFGSVGMFVQSEKFVVANGSILSNQSTGARSAINESRPALKMPRREIAQLPNPKRILRS